MSDATLNRVIAAAIKEIQKDRPDFVPFTVHDLRRTFSTLLNAAKFDSRFVEMALAHSPRDRISADIHSTAARACRKLRAVRMNWSFPSSIAMARFASGQNWLRRTCCAT